MHCNFYGLFLLLLVNIFFFFSFLFINVSALNFQCPITSREVLKCTVANWIFLFLPFFSSFFNDSSFFSGAAAYCLKLYLNFFFPSLFLLFMHSKYNECALYKNGKPQSLSTFMCIKCNELQLHPFLKLYLFFMHYELNFFCTFSSWNKTKKE